MHPVKRYKNIFMVFLSFYFFVAAIVLIKESIVLVGLGEVENLVSSVNNTLTGVFAGWFGTALLQSS